MLESMKKKLLYRLFRQNWNVGVTMHHVSVVAGLKGLDPQKQALEDVRWMDEQRGSFKADPFLASTAVGSEALVFYEHFDWHERKGQINVVRWNGRAFGRPQLSLNSPFHLSYPYVYEDEDASFYIPEHSAARDVSRYGFDPGGRALSKTTVFPKHEFVDSTLIKHQGAYWLFATHEGKAVNSDLYVYHSPSLRGPWYSHESNPVKSDSANARPAGQPFLFKGDLFRPAQNCSQYYGESIVINRIIALSPTEFIEVPETEIRAPAGSLYDFGLHTVSNAGEQTVIDGGRLESKVHPSLDKYSKLVR
jgi:hypothetical protein